MRAAHIELPPAVSAAAAAAAAACTAAACTAAAYTAAVGPADVAADANNTMLRSHGDYVQHCYANYHSDVIVNTTVTIICHSSVNGIDALTLINWRALVVSALLSLSFWPCNAQISSGAGARSFQGPAQQTGHWKDPVGT